MTEDELLSCSLPQHLLLPSMHAPKVPMSSNLITKWWWVSISWLCPSGEPRLEIAAHLLDRSGGGERVTDGALTWISHQTGLQRKLACHQLMQQLHPHPSITFRYRSWDDVITVGGAYDLARGIWSAWIRTNNNDHCSIALR